MRIDVIIGVKPDVKTDMKTDVIIDDRCNAE